MTEMDWILRDIREEEFVLHPELVMSECSTPDPIVLNRHDIMVKNPTGATERDLVCVLNGSRDAKGGRRTNYVFAGNSKCVTDSELHDGVFSPFYRDCPTIDDCNRKWDQHHGEGTTATRPTYPAREPAPCFPAEMTLGGMMLWCASIDAVMQVPDPTDRCVPCLWEEVGNFEKSRFKECQGTMENATCTAEHLDPANLFNQIDNYIERTGVGPKRIVLDVPRSQEEIPFGALESAKNGAIVNSKWKVVEHCWKRPHLCILSNTDPMEHMGTKMSADKIISVELRAFEQALKDGAASPTTMEELRSFSAGVTTLDN